MTLPELPEECSLEDLLAHAAREDIRLTARGGTLLYDAPARSAGPRLEAALRRHKPALLARLADTPASATESGDAEAGDLEAGFGATVEERAPASREQSAMVARHEVSKEPQVWNVALRLRFEGSLDVPALQSALEELIHRHQALRSRYVWEHCDGDGHTGTADRTDEPVRTLWQEVLAPRPVPLPAEDFSDLPAPERGERLDAACDRIAQTPFDVARGVQPRLRLFRTGEESCTLMLVLHHVACDGWSVSVLLRELSTLYRNAAGDRPPQPLAPPTGQCTDYARRQASSALSEREHSRRLAFWADQLAGCRADSGLPTDSPRPATLSGRGATAHAVVPAQLFQALRRFAREAGTTPFAVMLSVLGLLLQRRTGREDFVLCSAYANRADPTTDTLVTCTAGILTLRLRISGGEALADLCTQVTAGLAGGIAHFLPYLQIKEGLARHHGIELPDSVPLGATYQNSIDLRLELPGVSTVITDQKGVTARRECSFSIFPCADGTAEIHAEYSTDLYRPETVDGLLAEYVAMVDDLVPGDRDRALRSSGAAASAH